MFINFSQISERAYLLDYGNGIDISTNTKVLNHFNYIKSLNLKYINNIVPSFNKLLIQYDPIKKKHIIKLINKLKKINKKFTNAIKVHNIEICYDDEYALDYKRIEEYTKLDFDTFIKNHTKTNFHVFMIGFLPGLPFLGKMNHEIQIPRLETPRLNVISGSVGIVDNLCVIYPNNSPGGWNIIGRTKFKLFNPKNKNNLTILPGDKVKFLKIPKNNKFI